MLRAVRQINIIVNNIVVGQISSLWMFSLQVLQLCCSSGAAVSIGSVGGVGAVGKANGGGNSEKTIGIAGGGRKVGASVIDSSFTGSTYLGAIFLSIVVWKQVIVDSA
jgi:hypothetical protein